MIKYYKWKKYFLCVSLIMIAVIMLVSYIKNMKRRSWYDLDEQLKRTNSCNKYFEIFPAMALHKDLTEFEKEKIVNPFPLAFSHLVHTDVAILEVFLSLYFRPNNFHCIHVDAKASENIKNAVSRLVNCYSKIIQKGKIWVIPENESIPINYGDHTILDADIKCLTRLLDIKKNGKILWRYSLSVAGSELPIKSYWRFHNRISTTLGEHESSVESEPMPITNWNRLTKKQLSDSVCVHSCMAQNDKYKEDSRYEFRLPYNHTTIRFQMFKGGRNVILSAKDAMFMVYHPIAKYVYKWMREALNTEEHFFATMVRTKINPITNKLVQNTTATTKDIFNGICPRYAFWSYDCSGCYGKCIHDVCNFNTRDLTKIREGATECLMANKFSLEVDASALEFHLISMTKKVETEIDKWHKSNWSFHYLSKIDDLLH